MTPRLSIVIPAYNSENTIRECLSSLLSARECINQEVEIIVVDDGSKDRTADIAAEFPVSLIRLHSNKGRNFARCCGARAAKADIIINLDSDIVIKPDTLSRLLNYFDSNTESKMISGKLELPACHSDIISYFKNSKLSILYSNLPGQSAFIYGGLFAFRREVLPHLESKASYADDTDIAQRLASIGIKTHLLRELEVQHLKNYSLKVLLREEFRMGADWGGIAIRMKAWKRLSERGTALLHCIRHIATLRHLRTFIKTYGLSKSPHYIALSVLSASSLISGCITGLVKNIFSGIICESAEPAIPASNELLPAVESKL